MIYLKRFNEKKEENLDQSDIDNVEGMFYDIRDEFLFKRYDGDGPLPSMHYQIKFIDTPGFSLDMNYISVLIFIKNDEEYFLKNDMERFRSMIIEFEKMVISAGYKTCHKYLPSISSSSSIFSVSKRGIYYSFMIA